jgi:tRNA 2-thiouridine synthesizing protein B
MLYLVDEPRADVAFRTIRGDDDARVVLIQDGVLLDPDLDAPTYAVARDVQLRGVDLPADVEAISYDALVELCFEHEVRSFV